jgi:NADPH:quinone reductase-like Zn-dependent oxidoreductase
MKAAVIHSFGNSNVLTIENDFPVPELKQNQVLVKVIATSLNPLDLKIREGELKQVLGNKFPMIIGNDVSGTIVKCGKNVEKFQVGDNVYGMIDTNEKPSWFGFAGTGSYAEFVCTRVGTLSIKPQNISFEEAASVPLCALTAYQTLVNKVKIKKGNRILINGSSGGVGIFAVQIAKAYGAEITAIAGERNRKLMLDLGVDYFFDYRNSPISKTEGKFDIIYDVVSNSNYKESKHLLNDKGIFITNVPSPIAALFPWLRTKKKIKKKTFAWVTPNSDDLSEISKMISSKQIKAVIDSIYTLDEIGIAHRHYEKGNISGKIVVEINEPN